MLITIHYCLQCITTVVCALWEVCLDSIHTPLPPIDIIWAMMIVWRTRGDYRTARAVLEAIIAFSAMHAYYEQLLQVKQAWWDWGSIWWLTILLQCFDTVGWVTWPVKISSPNDLYCVEWDVKPYSTQLTVFMDLCHIASQYLSN